MKLKNESSNWTPDPDTLVASVSLQLNGCEVATRFTNLPVPKDGLCLGISISSNRTRIKLQGVRQVVGPDASVTVPVPEWLSKRPGASMIAPLLASTEWKETGIQQLMAVCDQPRWICADAYARNDKDVNRAAMWLLNVGSSDNTSDNPLRDVMDVCEETPEDLEAAKRKKRKQKARELAAMLQLPPRFCLLALELHNDNADSATSWMFDSGSTMDMGQFIAELSDDDEASNTGFGGVSASVAAATNTIDLTLDHTTPESTGAEQIVTVKQLSTMVCKVFEASVQQFGLFSGISSTEESHADLEKRQRDEEKANELFRDLPLGILQLPVVVDLSADVETGKSIPSACVRLAACLKSLAGLLESSSGSKPPSLPDAGPSSPDELAMAVSMSLGASDTYDIKTENDTSHLVQLLSQLVKTAGGQFLWLHKQKLEKIPGAPPYILRKGVDQRGLQALGQQVRSMAAQTTLPTHVQTLAEKIWTQLIEPFMLTDKPSEPTKVLTRSISSAGDNSDGPTLEIELVKALIAAYNDLAREAETASCTVQLTSMSLRDIVSIHEASKISKTKVVKLDIPTLVTTFQSRLGWAHPPRQTPDMATPELLWEAHLCEAISWIRHGDTESQLARSTHIVVVAAVESVRQSIKSLRTAGVMSDFKHKVLVLLAASARLLSAATTALESKSQELRELYPSDADRKRNASAVCGATINRVEEALRGSIVAAALPLCLLELISLFKQSANNATKLQAVRPLIAEVSNALCPTLKSANELHAMLCSISGLRHIFWFPRLRTALEGVFPSMTLALIGGGRSGDVSRSSTLLSWVSSPLFWVEPQGCTNDALECSPALHRSLSLLLKRLLLGVEANKNVADNAMLESTNIVDDATASIAARLLQGWVKKTKPEKKMFKGQPKFPDTEGALFASALALAGSQDSRVYELLMQLCEHILTIREQCILGSDAKATFKDIFKKVCKDLEHEGTTYACVLDLWNKVQRQRQWLRKQLQLFNRGDGSAFKRERQHRDEMLKMRNEQKPRPRTRRKTQRLYVGDIDFIKPFVPNTFGDLERHIQNRCRFVVRHYLQALKPFHDNEAADTPAAKPNVISSSSPPTHVDWSQSAFPGAYAPIPSATVDSESPKTKVSVPAIFDKQWTSFTHFVQSTNVNIDDSKSIPWSLDQLFTALLNRSETARTRCQAFRVATAMVRVGGASTWLLQRMRAWLVGHNDNTGYRYLSSVCEPFVNLAGCSRSESAALKLATHEYLRELFASPGRSHTQPLLHEASLLWAMSLDWCSEHDLGILRDVRLLSHLRSALGSRSDAPVVEPPVPPLDTVSPAKNLFGVSMFQPISSDQSQSAAQHALLRMRLLSMQLLGLRASQVGGAANMCARTATGSDWGFKCAKLARIHNNSLQLQSGVCGLLVEQLRTSLTTFKTSPIGATTLISSTCQKDGFCTRRMLPSRFRTHDPGAAAGKSEVVVCQEQISFDILLFLRKWLVLAGRQALVQEDLLDDDDEDFDLAPVPATQQASGLHVLLSTPESVKLWLELLRYGSPRVQRTVSALLRTLLPLCSPSSLPGALIEAFDGEIIAGLSGYLKADLPPIGGQSTATTLIRALLVLCGDIFYPTPLKALSSGDHHLGLDARLRGFGSAQAALDTTIALVGVVRVLLNAVAPGKTKTWQQVAQECIDKALVNLYPAVHALFHKETESDPHSKAKQARISIREGIGALAVLGGAKPHLRIGSFLAATSLSAFATNVSKKNRTINHISPHFRSLFGRHANSNDNVKDWVDDNAQNQEIALPAAAQMDTPLFREGYIDSNRGEDIDSTLNGAIGRVLYYNRSSLSLRTPSQCVTAIFMSTGGGVELKVLPVHCVEPKPLIRPPAVTDIGRMLSVDAWRSLSAVLENRQHDEQRFAKRVLMARLRCMNLRFLSGVFGIVAKHAIRQQKNQDNQSVPTSPGAVASSTARCLPDHLRIVDAACKISLLAKGAKQALRPQHSELAASFVSQSRMEDQQQGVMCRLRELLRQQYSFTRDTTSTDSPPPLELPEASTSAIAASAMANETASSNVSDTSTAVLEALGYDRALCLKAMELNAQDLNRAAEWLMTHSEAFVRGGGMAESVTKSPVLKPAKTATHASVSAAGAGDGVQSHASSLDDIRIVGEGERRVKARQLALTAGFGRELCFKALRLFRDDVNRAMEWLLDQGGRYEANASKRGTKTDHFRPLVVGNKGKHMTICAFMRVECCMFVQG